MAKQKPVDKGTKAETAVVNWARLQDFWRADRLTKTGIKDRGDVKLTDRVMVQVKDGYTEQREPSDYQIGLWLEAVDKQRDLGGWEIGLLVHKKHMKASPDAWRWYIDGITFAKLMFQGAPDLTVGWPPYVQLQGYMIPPLLRNAGYIA